MDPKILEWILGGEGKGLGAESLEDFAYSISNEEEVAELVESAGEGRGPGGPGGTPETGVGETAQGNRAGHDPVKRRTGRQEPAGR